MPPILCENLRMLCQRRRHMEQTYNLSGMLDLMISPAFAVTDGIIQYCNQAAQGYMICPGAPLDPLLETGREEYAALTQGRLYLSVRVEDQLFGASVTKMDGADIFLLDPEDSLPQLQAMALATRELREPLSNMLIATDKLESGASGVDAEMRLLKKSLYHMLRLTGNMSDAARYSQQQFPRQELRDITPLIGDVFEKAALLAEASGIRLQFVNYPQPLITLVDWEKLERAIYNALSNAIKFSQKGSVIDAKATLHGNKLHLSVQDQGSGIPDAILGNVYHRHLRQPSIEDSRFGIGLGMFMIRNAATTHGGTVLLEKGDPVGTKLTMTICIRKDLSGNLGSPRLQVDYAGEMDHGLIELADVLPSAAFQNI